MRRKKRSRRYKTKPHLLHNIWLWMGDEKSEQRVRGCLYTPLDRSSSIESFIVLYQVGRIYVETGNEAWECLLDEIAEDNDDGRNVEVWRYDKKSDEWRNDSFVFVPADYGQLLYPVIPAMEKMGLPRDLLIVAANICWWETQEPNPYLREWTEEIARGVNREMLAEVLKEVGYTRQIGAGIGWSNRKRYRKRRKKR